MPKIGFSQNTTTGTRTVLEPARQEGAWVCTKRDVRSRPSESVCRASGLFVNTHAFVRRWRKATVLINSLGVGRSEQKVHSSGSGVTGVRNLGKRTQCDGPRFVGLGPNLSRRDREQLLRLAPRGRDRRIELADVRTTRLRHIGTTTAATAHEGRNGLNQVAGFEPRGRLF